MSNGPDDDRLDSARVAYIGIGIVAGAALGIIIGLLLDQLALMMVAGAAIGLIVGAIVNARRSRERV